MKILKSNVLAFPFANQEIAIETRQQPVALEGPHDRERLEERRCEVERNMFCVERAVRLMALLSALAIVGLGYSTVLIPDWPQTMRQFFTYWPVKAHCALGFASSTCALLFLSLGMIYRRELSWLGEECRRLAEEVTAPEAAANIIPLVSGTDNQGPFPGDDWKEAA